MAFFRSSAPINLPVSMAGVTMGNRLLVVGCGDGALIGALALKTGLTGRACAVDDDEARAARAAAVAVGEGALVETVTAPYGALPFDDDAFDVAVLRDVLPSRSREERQECLLEVQRVLRKGGRALSIDTASAGWLAMFRKGPPAADIRGALESAGFRAVRTLAERDGLLFSEGVKAS